MKQLSFLLFVFGVILNGMAQEPFQNFGQLKIHEGGSMGFHEDLINNGTFNDNQGLAGFYNSSTLNISGANRPIFFDMEVMVDNGIFLDTGVGVTNNLNFVLGNVQTPKINTDVTLDFVNNGFYNGENELAKVDGYAELSAKTSFLFPIGDETELRPLLFTGSETTLSATAGYFFENPDFSPTLSQSFPTSNIGPGVSQVSQEEFWHLKATGEGTVTLSWNSRSAMTTLTEELQSIILVGWNASEARWESLRAQVINGSLAEGFVQSFPFNFEDYEILTFGKSAGSVGSDSQFIPSDYLLTPDGDGINDVLIFDGISPNNRVQIYNRYGALVFDKLDYTDEFNGISNNAITIANNNRLPVGVYFYVLTDRDKNQKFQGFLYLTVQE